MITNAGMYRTTITVNGTPVNQTSGCFVTPDYLCPDLLRLGNIGPADRLRGRVVRGFFWLMRWWKP